MSNLPRFQDIPLLKECSRLTSRQKELEYSNIQGPLNEEAAELGKSVQQMCNDIFKLTMDLAVCKEMYAGASSQFLNMAQLPVDKNSTSTATAQVTLAKIRHAEAEFELKELQHEMGLANNTLSSLRQKNMLLEYKLQREADEDKRIVQKTAADLARVQQIISDTPILVKAEKKKSAIRELNNKLENLSLKQDELKTTCAALQVEIDQSSKVPVTTFVRNLARICAQRSSTVSKMTETEKELRQAREKLELAEKRRGANDALNVTMLEDLTCTTMSQANPSPPATQVTVTSVPQNDTGREPITNIAKSGSPLERLGQPVQHESISVPVAVEAVAELNETVDDDDDMDQSSYLNASVADEPMEDEEPNPGNETSLYEDSNTTIGEDAMDNEEPDASLCQETLVETQSSQQHDDCNEEEQQCTQGLSESFHTGLTQNEASSAFDCLNSAAPSQVQEAGESAFELSAFQASQEAAPFDLFSAPNADNGAEAVLNISQHSEDAGADFLAFMNTDKPNESTIAPDFSFSKEFTNTTGSADAAAGGFDFNFDGSAPAEGGGDFNFDFSSTAGNTDGDAFSFNF